MPHTGTAKNLPPKPLWRRWHLMAPAVVVVLAGGWWLFFHKGADKPAFNTAPVQLGDIKQVVTAQGTLEPQNYVDVGAQVSGQLKKIYVNIGDTVKQGMLLAEIDPQVYEAKVKADQAQLDNLTAKQSAQNIQLALAEKTYKRDLGLVKTKAVSAQDFDQAEADYKVAQADLASLKAQVSQAQSTLDGDKANLSYTKIYAPMGGTIVTQSVQQGQTLNANQQAPTILEIADLDTMTVKAQVAEADVTSLKVGMPGYFTTLGNQDKQWPLKIRQVQPTPEVVNNVVLYDVLADVDNTSHQLMNGMSTQVFFIVGQAEGVLTIPASALLTTVPDEDSAAGAAYKVRVLENGHPALKIVHVGLIDRTSAQIKDGLIPGQQVIVPGPVTDAAKTRHHSRGPRL